jgi:hypothetical protein
VQPVLGGIVEVGQQGIAVVGDLGDGLGPLDAIIGREGVDGPLGVAAVLRHDDLVERPAGAGMDTLGQRTQNIIG